MLNSKADSRMVIILIIIACLVGFFLRTYFYIINRSLWLDEAMLALNIVNRSFLDLLKPLDLDQAAPVGFLLLQKVAICLLGVRDYVLRIVPMLSGLLSIPLMYAVTSQYRQSCVFFSLALFALSLKLIYYSSELKQYSTDVLASLLLLFIVPKCIEKNVKPHALIALGITGVMAMWFSHPSLFVLAGILLTLGLTFATNRAGYRLMWLIGVGVVCLINLAIIYCVSLRCIESNSDLLNYHSKSFAPLPWTNFRWYYDALIGMLSNPATLPTNLITVGLLIIGTFSFAAKKWQLMLVLLAPLLFTLVTSGLGRYPFTGRFLLFLLPPLLLLLNEGFERFWRILSKGNRSLSWLVSVSLIIYFLYGPTATAYKNLQSPPMREDIKSVMSYMKKHYLKTDVIYIYYGGGPAFEFYAPLYGFNRDSYTVGSNARNKPTQYIEDIKKINHSRRVWFVFSHNCSWCVVNEQDFILEHLNKIGLKKDEHTAEGASAYLYDLR